MPVVQEAFYIPEDIATGLAIGLYRRIGGVVRIATGPDKGQIVKHLDPITFPAAKEATGVLAKVTTFAKKNKKVVVIGGIIIVTVAVGTAIYIYKGAKDREPAVVKEFRKSLTQYIGAIRTGTMEIENIEALMGALKKMKAHKNYKKFVVKLSAEDIDILVNRIYEYTLKLAEDNDYDLDNLEVKDDSNPIINLQHYLSIQKKIFESAA